MGTHETDLPCQTIVNIFVKDMDTERKQIFTETLENLMSLLQHLYTFPKEWKKSQGLSEMFRASAPAPTRPPSNVA